MNFDEKKRDLFLTQQSYEKQINYWPKSNFFKKSIIRRVEDEKNDMDDRTRLSWSRCARSLEHLMLRYSAGEPLPELQAFYRDTACVEFIRHYQMFTSPDEKFFLWDIDSFQRVLWLLGLSYLFRLPDMPSQIAGWISREPSHGNDPLIALLLARLGVPNFPTGDKLLYPRTYAPLYEALNFAKEKNLTSAADALTRYLKGWYRGTKKCYWNNMHKDAPNVHFGYWSFEAGMMTQLLQLDDASYRNMKYYPKDLVDWARDA